MESASPKIGKTLSQSSSKAAQEGDGNACLYLGTIEDDPILKEKHYLDAIKKNCFNAYNDLAFLRELKNPEQALVDYKEGAKHNIGSTMRNLSICYQDGELNVTPDSQLAYQYLMMAAEKGIPEALTDLGRMYERGTPTTPKNDDIAQQLYEAAFKRMPKKLQSQYALGVILAEKKNPDPGQAALHFREAIKLGHVMAKDALWVLFQTNKSNSRVCFHAAIAFQTKGTPEQKTETRTAFNALFKDHPNIFSDLSSADDSSESVRLSLLDVSEKEIEDRRILFNIINSKEFLISDAAAIVLAFVYPLKSLNEKVVLEESEKGGMVAE